MSKQRTSEQQLDEIPKRAAALRAALSNSVGTRRLIIEKQIHAAWAALELKPIRWKKSEAQARVLHALSAAGYNLDGMLFDYDKESDNKLTTIAAEGLATQISFVTDHPCAYKPSIGKTVGKDLLIQCVEQWRPSTKQRARGEKGQNARNALTLRVLAALELMDPRNTDAAVVRLIDRTFPGRGRPTEERRREAELEADMVAAILEAKRKPNKRR